LKLRAEGNIPPVLGDADKFDQIMTNLISNAIKYSHAGGDVTVSVQSGGDTLTVSVRDEGIGIPSDRLERIFEKFERVDDRDTRQAGGTGIGLYLVKHLVERHDGEVWVESELGKGSTFTFRIPLHPPQADDDMGKLARSGPTSDGGRGGGRSSGPNGESKMPLGGSLWGQGGRDES
jgi:two-component system phosphate regulon sensor histidine kinase PhoR